MKRMSPRERVLAALAHRQPDRVPFSWGFGPTPELAKVFEKHLIAQGISWPKLRDLTDDKAGLGPTYTGPLPPGGNTFVGIFGIRMKSQSYGGGSYEEFTDFPLAGVEDPAMLDHYPWPDARHYDYTSLRAGLRDTGPTEPRATCYFGGNPFEIYCWMTGLEEAMVNLIMQPALVQRALDHITSFFEERMRRTLESCGDQVDLIFIADDLGGQNGLLMSRETYRAIVQPCHRRLTACARRLAPAAKVMHHSDGAVFDILPDLIEAGIHMLEAVQTDAQGMDPERLKSTYGDRLAFHGGISVQQLLPRADAATVARECRRLVEIFGRNGGYIAAPAHAIQVGTPPANILAMLRAVLGDDDYQAALAAAKL